MGASAQPDFLKLCCKKNLISAAPKTILYSGAANDEASLKSVSELFPRSRFITTDIEPSPSVELVWDQEQEIPANCRMQIDLFISTSVLEHIRRPWQAAVNIQESLTPHQGLIYLSAPWIWRYHEYPDDYWRFSPSSLDILFPRTRPLLTMWSTSPDQILHEANPHLDNQLSMTITSKQISKVGRKFLPYLLLHQLRVCTA